MKILKRSMARIEISALLKFKPWFKPTVDLIK